MGAHILPVPIQINFLEIHPYICQVIINSQNQGRLKGKIQNLGSCKGIIYTLMQLKVVLGKKGCKKQMGFSFHLGLLPVSMG